MTTFAGVSSHTWGSTSARSSKNEPSYSASCAEEPATETGVTAPGAIGAPRISATKGANSRRGAYQTTTRRRAAPAARRAARGARAAPRRRSVPPRAGRAGGQGGGAGRGLSAPGPRAAGEAGLVACPQAGGNPFALYLRVLGLGEKAAP